MNLKTKTPLLEFASDEKDLTEALSGVVFAGGHLWVAADELTSVERLTLRDGEVFGAHESFELHGIITLPAHQQFKPGGKKLVDQEIDIEGLDFEGGYLWLVGSHSVKRKKLDKDDQGKPDEKKIDKLSETERAGNRFILARVPVVKDAETGADVLAPTSPDKSLRAAQLLPGTMEDNALVRAIDGDGKKDDRDPHLADWLELPGKDNGFDVEGLAVAGGKVFLGLRGPVLRGWAIILELSVEDGDSPSSLRLKNIGPKNRPYRKHFLDLGGLGVRDLCLDGEDLLILAGPTMTHDGPVRIFRWKGGAARDAETVVWGDELKGRVLTLPTGEGEDRPEGMALVPGGNPPSVLVVYDAPAADRIVGGNAVRAEIFMLP